MKKLIYILILIYNFCLGQNLVPNPGFEIKQHIAGDSIDNPIINSYRYIQDWSLISPKEEEHSIYKMTQGYIFCKEILNMPDISPVYIKQVREELIKNPSFYSINPHSGNVVLRNWNPDLNTLFQAKLIKPLKKGNKYYIEFYYRVTPFYLRRTNHMSRPIGVHYYFHKNLGISFSNQYFANADKDPDGILRSQINRLIPEVPIPFTDSLPFKDWALFSAVYTASDNFDYVILGNFLNLKLINPKDNLVEKNNDYQILNYYFDDLKVIPYEEYLRVKFPEGKNLELPNIFFELNSSELKKESFRILEELFDYLSAFSEKEILVEGHTDNTGSVKANFELSDARANSIKIYLIGKGINANRILTKGYGSSKPVLPNTTDVNRAKNRRIEILIK